MKLRVARKVIKCRPRIMTKRRYSCIEAWLQAKRRSQKLQHRWGTYLKAGKRLLKYHSRFRASAASASGSATGQVARAAEPLS